MLLGDRKPADGMWVKAEEASNSRTLRRQGRGVALELAGLGLANHTPTTSTDLEPRAAGSQTEPKSRHILLSYSASQNLAPLHARLGLHKCRVLRQAEGSEVEGRQGQQGGVGRKRRR